MKTSRKNILFFIIALILISGFLYVYNTNYLVFNRVAERDFSVSYDEKISRIKISQDNEVKVTLEEKADGNWVLNNEHRANYWAVTDAISALRSMHVRHPVSLEEKDSIAEVLRTDGAFVEVYSSKQLFSFRGWNIFPFKRKIKSFYVGADLNDTGTYMMIYRTENPQLVYIPGHEEGLKNIFTPNPYAWQDRFISRLSANEVEIVEVEITDNMAESFRLYNSTEGVKFESIKDELYTDFTYDTLRVERFLAVFGNMYFERIIYGEEKDSIQNYISKAKPTHRISFKAANDEDMTIMEIFRRPISETRKKELKVNVDYDPHLSILRLNGDKLLYARYFVFNRLLRPLSFYKLIEE